MFVGGAAFSVTPISGRDWGISIAFGFLSIPVGALIRTIPNDPIRNLLVQCPPDARSQRPSGCHTRLGEVQPGHRSGTRQPQHLCQYPWRSLLVHRARAQASLGAPTRGWRPNPQHARYGARIGCSQCWCRMATEAEVLRSMIPETVTHRRARPTCGLASSSCIPIPTTMTLPSKNGDGR
jgi:hypothetical protein